jgi:deoxyribonuclease V
MLAVLDVHYRETDATAACLLAWDWSDAEPIDQVAAQIDHIEPYEPGAFYKRELPCLLSVLQKAGITPDVILVDGYVWLGDQTKPGLGAHLYQALEKKIPVVGVAKTKFHSATEAQEVRRSGSDRPLYVSSIGMDPLIAAEMVRKMHGDYRIPTLIKKVDQLCRNGK